MLRQVFSDEYPDGTRLFDYAERHHGKERSRSLDTPIEWARMGQPEEEVHYEEESDKRDKDSQARSEWVLDRFFDRLQHLINQVTIGVSDIDPIHLDHFKPGLRRDQRYDFIVGRISGADLFQVAVLGRIIFEDSCGIGHELLENGVQKSETLKIPCKSHCHSLKDRALSKALAFCVIYSLILLFLLFRFFQEINR